MRDKFKVVMTVENAAFEDSPKTEAARILRELADKIERGADSVTLRDINGNNVGEAGFTREY